jgi:hypothetical protein
METGYLRFASFNFEDVVCVHVAQDRDQQGECCKYGEESSCFIKAGEVLTV